MGNGKSIDVKVRKNQIYIRDYGRGIPLGKVHDCVSKINTGGKYDSDAFQKSVGLNGVGTKAVNALSEFFHVQSIRDNKTVSYEYSRGELITESKVENSTLRNGTKIRFVPDNKIFKNYKFIDEYIENQIYNYVYLNSGLTINYNDKKYFSENGLKDLLEKNTSNNTLIYPIIHLAGDDIEVAIGIIINPILENKLILIKMFKITINIEI